MATTKQLSTLAAGMVAMAANVARTFSGEFVETDDTGESSCFGSSLDALDIRLQDVAHRIEMAMLEAVGVLGWPDQLYQLACNDSLHGQLARQFVHLADEVYRVDLTTEVICDLVVRVLWGVEQNGLEAHLVLAPRMGVVCMDLAPWLWNPDNPKYFGTSPEPDRIVKWDDEGAIVDEDSTMDRLLYGIPVEEEFDEDQAVLSDYLGYLKAKANEVASEEAVGFFDTQEGQEFGRLTRKSAHKGWKMSAKALCCLAGGEIFGTPVDTDKKKMFWSLRGKDIWVAWWENRVIHAVKYDGATYAKYVVRYRADWSDDAKKMDVAEVAESIAPAPRWLPRAARYADVSRLPAVRLDIPRAYGDVEPESEPPARVKPVRVAYDHMVPMRIN